MSALTLPLKGVYFDQIVNGTKTEEYRLCTPYWRKRLEGRAYDFVQITRGYPARSNLSLRQTYLWKGYEVKSITHEFFGSEPVEVFAIRVGQPNKEGP